MTTEYVGNYIYEDLGSGVVLQFFNHAEGYVEPKNTTDYTQGFDYIYNYTDHRGNVRLSYTDANGDGMITVSSDPSVTEIVEENNYYPFGLKHKGYNFSQNGRNHKYGFGGKEEQDELELGWVDIIARNYDPALGRWMNLDPLAELMRRHSPYNYAFNNPIFFIDPDGMMPCPTGDCPEDEYEVSESQLDAQNEEKMRIHNEIKAAEKKFFDWITSEDPDDQFEVFKYRLRRGAQIASEKPKKPDFSGFKGKLYRIWTLGNIDGVYYDMDGNPVGPAPLGGLGAMGYISGGGYFKISKVAPDWAQKGAHVHFGKIELAIKPGANGSIVIKPVFSSQVNNAKKLASFNRIGNSFLKLLKSNPKLRQELIQKTTKARDALKVGNKLERSTSGELNFLIKSLNKIN